MSETYKQLFADKSPEFSDRVLNLCGLAEKEEYWEEENEIIRECFTYIKEEKSDRLIAYLLRDSQSKSNLKLNEGSLLAEELYSLTERNLPESNINEILEIVDLEIKEEYSFQEADVFLEGYQMFESEQDSDRSIQSLNLLDLKKMGGTKLSISDVLKLLPLCGLTEKEQYSLGEGKIFARCCQLYSEGKSANEIASCFGAKSKTENNSVKQVVDNIASLSQAQQGQILEMLATNMASQQKEVVRAFNQMTYAGLSRALQNGELQPLIDRKLEQNLSGNEITIQAMVQTCLEEEQTSLPPVEEEKQISTDF